MRVVSQTRPRASIIGLCGLAGSFQTASAPKSRHGLNPSVVNIDGTVDGSSRSGILIISERCAAVSVTSRKSLPMSTPYSGPLALTRGLRLSVAISSCTKATLSPQFHIVMTTLRSTPCGRGGAGGASPAAMRSVQSTSMSRARPRPKRVMKLFISDPR